MSAHVSRGWLRVPYEGVSTARLTLTINGNEHRAFYDRDSEGSWAQVRVPEGMRDRVRVALSADGRPAGSFTIRL